MATQFGCITEFQPATDAVKAYLERVNLYFTANDVPEAKQVPILLSSIGAPTYALLRDLLAPGAPGTKSLAEISATLTQHFEPKRAVIAERFTNGTSQWEKVLLNLMRFYVTSPHVVILGSFFYQALRDRFVCGWLAIRSNGGR